MAAGQTSSGSLSGIGPSRVIRRIAQIGVEAAKAGTERCSRRQTSIPVHLYDTETWKLKRTLKAKAGSVKELQWGPENRRLASISGDGTLRLWDPVSGQVVLAYDPGTTPRSLQWSQDGNTIVVSAENRMHVFRMGVTQ